jgi:hypothetical protein
VDSRGWSAAEPADAFPKTRAAAERRYDLLRQIPLVERNAVYVQQPSVFVQERFASMMFGLPLDVFNQAILVGVGNRERAVSVLPTLESPERSLALQPMTAAGLNFLNVLCDLECGRNCSQDVNMVVDAADSVQMALQVLMDSPDVFVWILPMAVDQCAFAILRREYDMEDELRVCVGHGRLPSYVAATRPVDPYHFASRGCAALHPWLFTGRRSAAASDVPTE